MGGAVVPAALAAEAAAYGAEHEALEEYLRTQGQRRGPPGGVLPAQRGGAGGVRGPPAAGFRGVGSWGPAGSGSRRGPRGPEQAERAGTGKDDVELYVRTYSTVLRSSGEVKLRALEAAHIQVRSSLHPGAGSEEPGRGGLDLRPAAPAGRRHPRPAGGAGAGGGALPGPPGPRRFGLAAPGGSRPAPAVALGRGGDDDGAPGQLVRPGRRHPLPGRLPDRVEQAAPAPGGAWPGSRARAGLDGAQPPAPEALAALGERLGFSADDWRRLQAIWGDSLLGASAGDARRPAGSLRAPAGGARRGVHPPGAPVVEARSGRRSPRAGSPGAPCTSSPPTCTGW